MLLFKKNKCLVVKTVSERVILHCDLNNFFASVECLGREDLKGKPVAVGGSVEQRHGIILAKNEAAKKYGVKTAEAIWQAVQKCPNLIVLPPHYDRYVCYSRRVRTIYEQYTDLIEPFGIDECWLDVTGSTKLFGPGEAIAEQIRQTVKGQTGLTVSVGVSFNKIFAKLGSDYKKPDAVTVFRREDMEQLIWPLAAQEMLGVGSSTLRSLQRIGVFTIGDLAKTDPHTLRLILGKGGETLWRFANGLDLSPVSLSGEEPVPKSVGRSTTTPRDMKTPEDIALTLLWLSERVSRELRANHALATVLQVHLRDNKLNVTEHQRRLQQPIRLAELLRKIGYELILEAWDGVTPLRSVGIRAVGLVHEDESFQLCFSSDYEQLERMEQLERAVERMKEKYGKDAVLRCRQLSGGKLEQHLAFKTIVS